MITKENSLASPIDEIVTVLAGISQAEAAFNTTHQNQNI